MPSMFAETWAKAGKTQQDIKTHSTPLNMRWGHLTSTEFPGLAVRDLAPAINRKTSSIFTPKRISAEVSAEECHIYRRGPGAGKAHAAVCLDFI